MSRVRPALVSLLVVVATATVGLAGGAVTAPVQPADDPVVGTSETTTRVLLLTQADAAQFDGPAVSVTDSLDAGHADLEASFHLSRVAQQLEATDNRTQRRAILENATEWAGERVDRLRQREAAARASFASGDITATEYLLTLGTVHQKAVTLERFLREPTADATLYRSAEGFSSLQQRINRESLRLESVKGPVRDRIGAVVRGDRDALRVHVTVGNGVMLSTIENGRYVRETVRPDNANPELGGSIGSGSALIQSTYPWLNNNSIGPSLDFESEYAYYYTAGFEHGQLTAYIDTTTERVFVERQQKRLDSTPVTYDSRASGSNTTLLVSRTYAGGPVQIRVENATGEPIDAPVSLNGTRIGQTGDDGELWALSPAGEYRVSTSYDAVSLDVNATARPAP